MKILAVESSCDETAVAVVEDGRTVLTDCIASQVALHRLYGGVVPELASRKHIEAIYALADEALSRASMTRQEIDAIAVTYAPGLIGAVLVGVNFAKAAAYSLGSGSPYPGAYRGQLSGVSRSGAAVSLPRRLRRAYADRRRAGLHKISHHGHNARRRGRGVL